MGATRVDVSPERWRAWLGWFARHHRTTALIAYTAITLLLTFPAILHLGDAIIGPLPVSANDNFWYVWYPWAFRQAVSWTGPRLHPPDLRAVSARPTLCPVLLFGRVGRCAAGCHAAAG